MNRYCMQRRWKKTLKLPFLTPKRFDFYLIFFSNRFVFFVSLSIGSFSLFLHLSFSFLSIPLQFRLTSIFVLVPFLFISLHVDFFYELVLYAEKVEKDTKVTIFNSKKFQFLSHSYLKQVCFSLFLCVQVCFSFACFQCSFLSTIN